MLRGKLYVGLVIVILMVVSGVILTAVAQDPGGDKQIWTEDSKSEADKQTGSSSDNSDTTDSAIGRDPWGSEWNPFKEMEDLQKRMNRMFDHSFMFRFDDDWQSMRGSFPKSYQPAMDVYKGDGSIIVKVDLPGLGKDDIVVKITGNQLVVTGERKSVTSNKQDNFFKREVRSGAFSRIVALPDNVTAEKAHAKMENGVLLVNVPIDEKKPTEVTVKVE